MLCSCCSFVRAEESGRVNERERENGKQRGRQRKSEKERERVSEIQNRFVFHFKGKSFNAHTQLCVLYFRIYRCMGCL